MSRRCSAGGALSLAALYLAAPDQLCQQGSPSRDLFDRFMHAGVGEGWYVEVFGKGMALFPRNSFGNFLARCMRWRGVVVADKNAEDLIRKQRRSAADEGRLFFSSSQRRPQGRRSRAIPGYRPSTEVRWERQVADVMVDLNLAAVNVLVVDNPQSAAQICTQGFRNIGAKLVVFGPGAKKCQAKADLEKRGYRQGAPVIKPFQVWVRGVAESCEGLHRSWPAWPVLRSKVAQALNWGPPGSQTRAHAVIDLVQKIGKMEIESPAQASSGSRSCSLGRATLRSLDAVSGKSGNNLDQRKGSSWLRGISFSTLLKSRWPVFALHMELLAFSDGSSSWEDENGHCSSHKPSEDLRDKLLLHLNAKEVMPVVDVLRYIYMSLELDLSLLPTTVTLAGGDLGELNPLRSSHAIAALRNGHVVHQCVVGMACALCALAAALHCHAQRWTSAARLASEAVDSAQRRLEVAGLGNSVHRLELAGWPLLSLLRAATPMSPDVFTHAPGSASRLLISYDAREAAYNGGNWAETFARNAFGDDSRFIVVANVPCADVWIFRDAWPQNFGGVALFVDGEIGLDASALAVVRRYPRLLYLGVAPEVQRLGVGLGLWLPFCSTSFTQRLDFDPTSLSLAQRAPPGAEKQKFCAYLAYKCWPHREALFERLRAVALKYGLGDAHALSACGQQGNESTPASRHSKAWLDDAVAQLRPYRFAVAFENRGVAGYVTEKIVNAFLAGAVPIYWGPPEVLKIFNPKAFIYASSYDGLDGVVERVVQVALDPVAYEQMASEPVLNETSLRDHFSWHRAVRRLLRRRRVPMDVGIGSDLKRRVFELHERQELASSGSSGLGRVSSALDWSSMYDPRKDWN